MPDQKTAVAPTSPSAKKSAAKTRKPAAAASPVARRRAARRRGPSRGRAPAGKTTQQQNQLKLLESNNAELRGDLQALKAPADKAHMAIEKVKAPLLLPGKIKGKVKRVKTIAKGLDSLARLVSLVPGPIGVGAKGLHRALVPLLGKRGAPGVLDRIISALGRVERAVKPVVTKLNQAEKPIDAARDDLADLLVHVGRLEAIAASVRGHYGATPPEEVQACLGKLNQGLAPVVTPMRALRKRAEGPLGELNRALDDLAAALKPLNDIARDVDRALARLESKAVREMSKVLNRIAKAVKPILDLVDWVIENTIGRLLKLLKVNLGAIDRFFRNLVAVLNPFKGLQRRIDRITRDLQKRVAALPAVAALVRALAALPELERQLDREIEKALRGACRNLLLPQVGKPTKGAGRRRKARL